MCHPVGEERFGYVPGPQVAPRGVEEVVINRWDVREGVGHVLVEPDEHGLSLGGRLSGRLMRWTTTLVPGKRTITST